MYVTIEGVSRVGKSTLISLLQEKLVVDNQQCVVFKGNGQINHVIDWDEYNKYMHSMLYRLNELNDLLIILHDRGFTEYIMTCDPNLCRIYRCYKRPIVILLEADVDDLAKRGSCGGHKRTILQHINLYNTMTSPFDRIIINTTKNSIEETVEQAYKFVMEKYDESFCN